MNLKKILLKVVTSITIIMFALIPCSVFAENSNSTGTRYFKVSEFDSSDENERAYALGEVRPRIWKILEYTDSTYRTLKPLNKSIYCLNPEKGMGSKENAEEGAYNKSYGKEEISELLKNNNDLFNGLFKGNIKLNDEEANRYNTSVKEANRYNTLLAAIDLFYLPDSNNLEKNKEEKDKITEIIFANNNTGHEIRDDVQLTDDEIISTQKAVIWYIANLENDLKANGQDKDKYNKITKAVFLYYKKYSDSNANYTALSDLNKMDKEGEARACEAKIWYDYLIKTAMQNSENYSNSLSSKVPATLATTELNYEESGSNYIIGPINIKEEKEGSVPYTIDFTVKNGDTAITNYKLLDSTKKEVSSGTTVRDLVGKDFYISVPKDSTTTISIETKIKYNATTFKIWTHSTNEEDTQPLLIPERTEKDYSKTLSVTPKPKPTGYFDLKLIKRIVAVNDQEVPERIKKVDVSKLNKKDENGKIIATTGEYKLNKEPVGVRKGDIVTYTFRVYNEGTIDGYASKITEDIPEGLEFIYEDPNNQESLTDAEKEAIDFNNNALWNIDKLDSSTPKARVTQISTEYLSNASQANLIKAFGENDGTKTENDISYKEVSVKLKVVSDSVGQIIRNEACISDDTDKDGNKVDDRDSDTEKWVKYEDDEDYDNIILQVFDLALRKFIIAVSDDNKIENSEYLKNSDGTYTREPKVDTSKLNTTDENGKMITTAIYNHTKEPVLVKQNDFIVYNLRVYNEGDIDGYASEIKDHLPPYLEFVDGEFNKQYGWSISEDGRTATTRYLENSKIDKAKKDKEGKYILAYKEVPIMCKVKENAKTSENITNIADITEYKDENKKDVTDRDSQADNVVLPKDEELPSYKETEKESYVPGQQDDDDFEKVIVKTFDLALRKWVTQAIVIDKNGQSVTQTGHQPYDDPEQVVKVELHRKKLNEVTVKFRYSIRVINEGEIAGYAKEVTDYVPQGLKFVAEDNQGWIDEGNNVISTKMLENTLLQPGDYKDVEVVLTWINSQDNMGVMINTAEISQDYNEYDIPDKDSTPDNQKPGEDDIDDAPVMLSISTGQMRIYFTLGFIVLITIAGGVVIIKKYVL